MYMYTHVCMIRPVHVFIYNIQVKFFHLIDKNKNNFKR